MIVIFDTNIWKSNLYLRAGAGAAARFYIKNKGARVALPEVVRLEVEHHLRSDIISHIDKIKDSHGRLLAMFGQLKDIVLPTDTEINKAVSQAFIGLGIDWIDVPFSLESARSSFIKTINKQAPSDQSQQFKDGVLWADCLALLAKDDVSLVTNDAAFYEQRKYDKGLASSLTLEAKNLPHKIELVSKLTDLIQSIRQEVSIDYDALSQALLHQFRESLIVWLQDNGFELADRVALEPELFATEDSDNLFLEVKISFRCRDYTEQRRGDGIVTLVADGTYNTCTRNFSRLGLQSVELKFRDQAGEQSRKIHILRGESLSIGHKELFHTIREKLF
jgi:hypothetical protein